MSKPTLQNVKDFAAINGISEKIAENYWMNFECQNWVRANGQKITKWQVHFKWWFQNGCWQSKTEKKQKLFPIKGKVCSVKGCRMPAVYLDATGNYDSYKCSEHLPESVKAMYR